MGKSSKILSLFFGLLIALFVVVPVLAQEADDTSSSDSTRRGRSLENIQKRIDAAEDRAESLMMKREERASRAADRSDKREARLSERRLKICESRSARISNRVSNVLARGGKLNTGHVNIQNRVDEFYQNKLVAEGYVLINYDGLVAAMDAEKANVESVLELAGDSGPAFDCNSDDPMGQIGDFKEDLRGLIDANKAYRLSVKDFVSAVLVLAKEARADKEAEVDTTDTATPTVVDEGGVE